MIYYYAKDTKPVYVGDSMFVNMLGDVRVYHNGAVITCDSAVRSSDNNRFEFFKNVVINQNTTYVYGDRALYAKDQNMARVFAPIIKIVDGDATLYTRNFTFNTLNNVGRFYGGGTMKQANNYMEARQGYYFADSSYMIGVGDVEMRNPDYQLQSDSVVYNMNTEVASFWTKTYIWNSKGEILSAHKGEYHNRTTEYKFRSDAYILTKDQEVWADSLDYHAGDENAWMYGNIQMRDDDNAVMAFGDYGQYWGGPQNAMLTRNPSMLSYDKEKSDTMYMRSDSMFFFTFDRSVVLHEQESADANVGAGEELITPGTPIHGGDRAPADSVVLSMKDYSTAVALPDSTEMSARELKRWAKAEKKRMKEAERKEKLIAKLKVREEEEAARRKKREEREAAALARRQARRAKRGIVEPVSDSTLLVTDSLSVAAQADSLSLLPVDSLLIMSPDTPEDSLQRVVYAYNNVRIYRSDFQAVCDSLVGFSIDSTMHMYIDPVLWQGDNQMTASVIDLYTKNQQLERAFFSGEPMMISEVEPGDKYNQVKGRTMQSFFRNNDIYRHDVDANAQTLYYMQDGKTGDYMGFLVAEAANITFLIDSMQMDKIIFRLDPSYVIYPMDKIPENVTQRLPGFGWHIDRRPEIAAVFDRRIRESERSVYEGMPQPQFPLTGEILRERDNYISRGMMVERNDRLTPEDILWIRGVDPMYGRDPEDDVSRGANEAFDAPVVSDSLPASGLDSLNVRGGQWPAGDSTGVRGRDSLPVQGVPVPARDSVVREEVRQTEDSMAVKQPVDQPDALRVAEPDEAELVEDEKVVEFPARKEEIAPEE